MQSLVNWGLTVTAHADGPVAIDCLKTQTLSQHFDVALSDWRLPGAATGLDVLREAASSPCLRLLMTGEPRDSLGELPTGITLLTKPVRPLKLRAVLTAYLLRTNPDKY